MPALPWIDVVLVQALGLLLIWAAVKDCQSFIIPNRISISILLLYPAHVIAAPYPVDWISGVGVATAAFLAGAFAFARGWFGGGDVKLFAASALWAGPELLSLLLLVTAVAGGLLALSALARPHLVRLRAGLGGGPAAVGATPCAAGALRAPLPYGVAIAAGGLAVTAQLLAR